MIFCGSSWSPGFADGNLKVSFKEAIHLCAVKRGSTFGKRGLCNSPWDLAENRFLTSSSQRLAPVETSTFGRRDQLRADSSYETISPAAPGLRRFGLHLGWTFAEAAATES